MKKLIFTSLFVFLVCCSTFAQSYRTEDNQNCPTVEVTGPTYPVKPGETMVFTAELRGDFDAEKIEYVWQTGDEKIVSGQGTPVIVVAAPSDAEQFVHVRLELRGLPEFCKNEFRGEGFAGLKWPERVLFDTFGEISEEDFETRFNAFNAELQNRKFVTGYIVNYGSPEDVAARERLIRDNMRYRHCPSDRIVFVNGGVENKIRTRLWIVPEGADTTVMD